MRTLLRKCTTHSCDDFHHSQSIRWNFPTVGFEILQVKIATPEDLLLETVCTSGLMNFSFGPSDIFEADA